MNKLDNIASPSSCLNRAQPDEPLFILRANDPLASHLVREWVFKYLDVKMFESGGEVTQEQVDKANDALRVAADMEQWRSKQPR